MFSDTSAYLTAQPAPNLHSITLNNLAGAPPPETYFGRTLSTRHKMVLRGQTHFGSRY
ncbi:MAG: hypothetical protein IPN94_12130 [Sphingobacteriales bacterium]|nr:hypothetical protein [Sphingobacteriales bacterium]